MPILIDGEKVDGQFNIRLSNLLSILARDLNESRDPLILSHVRSELELATELLGKIQNGEEKTDLVKRMKAIQNVVKE